MSSVAFANNDLKAGHAVFLLVPLQGHWTAPLVFIVKLIKECPGTVCTILVVGDYLEKINIALDLYFIGEEAVLKDNIRVIQTGGKGLVFEELLPVVYQNFAPYFESLVSSSDIVCQSGKTYAGIKSPDVLILDMFYRQIIHISRSIAKTRIPIYAWIPVNNTSILRFGHKEIGGWGNVAVQAPILAKQLNKSVAEMSYEMYVPTKGELISCVPGLPTAYDYECHIEQAPLSFLILHIELWNTIYQLLRECDGVLTASDDVFEPEATEALRDWFAETKRTVYALGPLTPEEYDPSISDVSNFLSRMQKTHGEHSVLYVSMGTYFAPQGPGLVKILQVLLDMGIPMVYSLAAQANIPEDLKERLKNSDQVYASPWIPQRFVLNHSGIGAFLSHCGQNSTSEAISAGVPMIAYPITVDQPINAMFVSVKFDIGYELLEIRTGTALAPAYRGVNPTGTLEAVEKEIREVIAKAFGSDGEEKRRNIRLLRDKRNALWNEGGASRRDFERFIKDAFSQSV